MTSTFLLFWIVSALVTAAVMALEARWFLKQDKNETITLSNIIVGAGLCLVPYLNLAVLAVAILVFMNLIAPKIVVFGKHND